MELSKIKQPWKCATSVPKKLLYHYQSKLRYSISVCYFCHVANYSIVWILIYSLPLPPAPPKVSTKLGFLFSFSYSFLSLFFFHDCLSSMTDMSVHLHTMTCERGLSLLRNIWSWRGMMCHSTQKNWLSPHLLFQYFIYCVICSAGLFSTEKLWLSDVSIKQYYQKT